MFLKNKTLSVLTLVFLMLILSLASVSASEDIEINDLNDNSVKNGISGSFQDLQNAITGDNIIIELNGNVTVQTGEVSVFESGIKIEYDNVTIDGKGYTVNGKNLVRIFNITGHNVILTNIVLVGGNSIEGGAIYNTGNNLTINDSVLDNNNAIFETNGISNDIVVAGGAIYNTGNNLNIVDSFITNNTAKLVDIGNSINTNYDVLVLGGAIYNVGNNLNINSSTISNNSASMIGLSSVRNKHALGGAIYNKGNNTQIEKLIAENNYVYSNSYFASTYYMFAGAVFYNDYINNFTVSSSYFFNNSVLIDSKNTLFFTDTNGGGVFSNNYVDNFLIKDGNIFENNNAPTGGVILNNYANNFVIEGNNSFIDNNALGGGVMTNYFSNISIRGINSFKNNYAISLGIQGTNSGVIYGLSSNVLIEGNNSFEKNYAEYGGVIYVTSGNINIHGSNVFYNNSAMSGGVIVGTVNIHGSNVFYNNSAMSGGVIAGISNINGFNIFHDNFANNGGVISGPTTINGSNRFFNNSAVNGGVIYSFHGNSLINGTNSFTENNATNGAVIYNGGSLPPESYDTYGNFSIIGNNIFDNNSATSNGGVIANYAILKIKGQNTFNYNNASNGGVIYNIFDNGYYIILNNIPGGIIGIHGNYINLNISGENSFNNNFANNNGGAIYNRAFNVSITGENSFKDNLANNLGGVIFNINSNSFNNGENFTIIGAIFENNDALINGSVIYNEKAHNFTIGDVSSNSESDVYGIFNDNGFDFLIYESDFKNTNFYNNGSASVLLSNFTKLNSKYGIFNDMLLFLNKNNMSSDIEEKIYNNGTITSLVYVVMLDNETKIALVDENFVLTGNLYDDNWNVIVGQELHFLMDDDIIDEWSDYFKNGTYPKDIVIDFGPGLFPLTGNYVGGTNLEILPGAILVKNSLETFTTINNVTDYVGETVTITGTVVDERGLNVNGTILLTLPDKSVVNVNVTDGKFSYNWTIPKNYETKDYPTFALFNGTKTLTSSNATGKVTVLRLKTVTTITDVEGYPGDSVTITGTVVDELGKNINGNILLTLPDGSIVTVEVINGKFGYDWTIPDDFKAGEYPTFALYDGNYLYYGSNATGKAIVKVKDTPTPGPTPNPNPEPKPDVEDNTDSILENKIVEATMEKTGNPIFVLLLVLIASLVVPLRRRK
ncbi:beta strand repeat-containing protein [Methanobrevibacter sp. DSM 116169]|uniref:beta strand repeat-containing protein n=1 Tax=Methanobrevibacter sp. DSM 116169 TaxID=3242727 RepID=UPI0038FCE9DF